MAKLDTLQNLPKNFSDSFFVKAIGTSFKVIKYSVIHKFEHQIQSFLSSEDFNQIYQVVMSELL